MKTVKLNDDNNNENGTGDTSPLKSVSETPNGERSPPPPPPPSSPPPREREGGEGKGGEIQRQRAKTTAKIKKKDAGVWRPPGKIVKGSGLHVSSVLKNKKKKQKKPADKFAWISL